MKKFFFFITSFMMLTTSIFSQKEAKLTVEVSNDSVLIGNYIEVKFTIEDTNIENFEAPNFKDFTVIGGPNQSASTIISNGTMSQSTAYTYYLEPNDIGNYYILPAFVDTGEEILESMPLEIIVAANPDGIIQNPQEQRAKNFFDKADSFGGNGFFNDFFKDEFPSFFHEIIPIEPEEEIRQKPNQKKKKRKIYRL